MSNTTIGPGTKKETVYSGPTQQSKQGTVYNGPAPSSGTVYDGPAMKPPAGGTVYGGPAPGATAQGGFSPETVYNPARLAGAQPASTTTHPGAAKGAGIFFLIAGFSVINSVLIFAHAPFVLALGLAVTRVGAEVAMATVVVLNIIAVGIFVMLGLFVRHGSKTALVIGMLLYGGDTALLVAGGDAAVHIPSILVHAIFLIGMFKALSQHE